MTKKGRADLFPPPHPRTPPQTRSDPSPTAIPPHPPLPPPSEGDRNDQHHDAARHPTRDRNRHHPPLPVSRLGRGPRGTPPADQSDEVARKRARRRFLAGRAARDDAEARPLLDDGIRLAQGRGEAQ